MASREYKLALPKASLADSQCGRDQLSGALHRQPLLVMTRRNGDNPEYRQFETVPTISSTYMSTIWLTIWLAQNSDNVERRQTTKLKLLTVSFIIYYKEHYRKYCKSQTVYYRTLAINPCMMNKKPQWVNKSMRNSLIQHWARMNGHDSSTSTVSQSPKQLQNNWYVS